MEKRNTIRSFRTTQTLEPKIEAIIEHESEKVFREEGVRLDFSETMRRIILEKWDRLEKP